MLPDQASLISLLSITNLQNKPGIKFEIKQPLIQEGFVMNVLVIENEEFLAENLCQYLKSIKNLTTQHVTTATEALQLLLQKPFDLVVSDIWLPDSKSDEWLLEVGKIHPGQNLIVMSSHPIPHQISSSDKLNVIGYFEKPFDLKIITNLINRITKS
jgi:DNA-binding NtrC family response regulator